MIDSLVRLQALQDLESAINNRAQGFASDSTVRDSCPNCNSYILSAHLLPIANLSNNGADPSPPVVITLNARVPTLWVIIVGVLGVIVVALSAVVVYLLKGRRTRLPHTELVEQ